MALLRSQFDELVAPVRAAMASAKAAAATVGDETLRRTQQKALATVEVAVERWAVGHRQEVVNGTRPFAKWSAHGQDLLGQLRLFNADLKSFEVQFSRLAENLGNAARWVLEQRDKVLAKIDALEADYARLGEQRRVLEERRAAGRVTPTALSPEAQELLYGATAANALRDYERGRGIVEGLVALAKAVRGGTAELAPDGNGEIVVVPKTPAGAQTLGAVQIGVGLVVGAAVLGLIASAAAIATSLWAYFRHLDERVRADVAQAELEIVKNGTPAQIAALERLKRLQIEADRARQPKTFWDDVVDVGAPVLGAAALSYGAYRLVKSDFGQRLLRRWGLA